MKVKQTVEVTADHIYCGWKGLEITDIHGNEVIVAVTDEQIASLAERLTDKAKDTEKKNLEKLREQLENEDADCS